MPQENGRHKALCEICTYANLRGLERIWLAVEAVDMRSGIDGLSARIQASLARTPCDGTAYAFTNRRRNRLKLLVWDGTGVWLSQRRLHRGAFIWPSASDPVLPFRQGRRRISTAAGGKANRVRLGAFAAG